MSKRTPFKENFFKNQRQEPRKKKEFGQHFLRKNSTVDNMISAVKVTPETTVLEIGCGDGFLTHAVLEQTRCKKLICYEIDPEWIEVVRKKISDPRLEIRHKNFLEITHEEFQVEAPWVVLANVPYQITFPIFFTFVRHKQFINEGVVMIQEEVAQKIVAKQGRGYNPTSLLLQHHFDVSLMEKVEPEAFTPPPKVHSRLLYFKPKTAVTPIPNEEAFWKFAKLCFASPRRTLANNLKQAHYALEKFDEATLKLRAQQISFVELLEIWQRLQS
ncbi:16S rRNA (adenine(1518)-N(6)/adenine(1519)-N(6))-dimethyltransferase RsmA [Candidatus Babeliales bacterium]|nr:16S rRNA (adenine(1518)-N(6)/adenine(1519)-N(6))-dimethyltransferase RsmA [Candidatus Babeliales bacterium]